MTTLDDEDRPYVTIEQTHYPKGEFIVILMEPRGDEYVQTRVSKRMIRETAEMVARVWAHKYGVSIR